MLIALTYEEKKVLAFKIARTFPEDYFVIAGLRAGMTPREILSFLDTIARWRKLGIGEL